MNDNSTLLSFNYRFLCQNCRALITEYYLLAQLLIVINGLIADIHLGSSYYLRVGDDANAEIAHTQNLPPGNCALCSPPPLNSCALKSAGPL